MDVWYTQAGHGAGFFDRGISDDLVEKLEKGAKKFGHNSQHVFAQDGKVYIEGMKFASGGAVGTGGTSDSADSDAPILGGTMGSSMKKGGKVGKQKYPALEKIAKESPNTVIDDVWEEVISPEALEELKKITKLKSYEEILDEYEGYEVEDMLAGELDKYKKLANGGTTKGFEYSIGGL